MDHNATIAYSDNRLLAESRVVWESKRVRPMVLSLKSRTPPYQDRVGVNLKSAHRAYAACLTFGNRIISPDFETCKFHVRLD